MSTITMGALAIRLYRRGADALYLTAVLLTQPGDPGDVMSKLQALNIANAPDFWVAQGWHCPLCKTTFFVSGIEQLRHSPCCDV